MLTFLKKHKEDIKDFMAAVFFMLIVLSYYFIGCLF